MENWFKDVPTVNILMIIVSILAVISFLYDKNWNAAIWAFNTLLWVFIATMYEIWFNNYNNGR